MRSIAQFEAAPGNWRESLDVIWAYSQYLQVNDFQIPADVEVAQQFRDARPKFPGKATKGVEIDAWSKEVARLDPARMSQRPRRRLRSPLTLAAPRRLRFGDF